jgi:hypothetical protein
VKRKNKLPAKNKRNTTYQDYILRHFSYEFLFLLLDKYNADHEDIYLITTGIGTQQQRRKRERKNSSQDRETREQLAELTSFSIGTSSNRNKGSAR